MMNRNDTVTNFAAIFEAITADPRYLANLDWGNARRGHPEGTVRAHIAELEANLKKLRPKLIDQQFWKLRVLIHTHDTFKAESLAGVAITHPQSHASLASAFLAEFCDDPDLLAMVQFHDEPYSLWRRHASGGTVSGQRMEALLVTIRDWNLFSAFLIIDGCTDGKSRDPLNWWFGEVIGRVESTFTAADLL